MRACKKSAPFGLIWPRLARLALLAKFCPLRPFLASFFPVWPRLALFDSVWHHLAPFGPDWPHLALLGHSSIWISRYFKVPIRKGGEWVSEWVRDLVVSREAIASKNQPNLIGIGAWTELGKRQKKVFRLYVVLRYWLGKVHHRCIYAKTEYEM